MPTIKAVKQHIRNIYVKYCVGDVASVQDTKTLAQIYDPYFNETGKRMGDTVKVVFLNNHTQYKRTNADMYFFNATGESDNCSKDAAVRFYVQRKLPDQIQLVKRVFRSDISDQTLDYKMKRTDAQTNEIRCDVCFKYFDFTEIDIDHCKVSFIELLGHFLAANNTSLKNIPLERSTEQKKIGVWTLCQPWRQRWQEAHAEFSNLRTLCKPCHVAHGL